MAQRGRPRSFDRAVALRRALDVFWAKGFEAASVSDLTQAMDINSPSLYAAFGSKETLFKEALDLYLAEYGSEIWDTLPQMGTAREAVAAMLRKTVDAYTRPGRPRGCLVVLSAVNCATRSVQDILRKERRKSLGALRERLERGVRERDWPRGTNVAQLAEFYSTVQLGLAFRARDGASRDAMLDVVNAAISAWEALVPGQ